MRWRPGPFSNHRVLAVVNNDWEQMLRSRVVVYTTFGPPVLLVVAALMVLGISSLISADPGRAGKVASQVMVGSGQALAILSNADSMRAALLSPFLMLFQIVPLIVPVTLATYSIIGEKQSKSLEALLATPIRTWELLLGKGLAAAIPGIMATWYSYVVFALASRLLVGEAIYRSLILSPTWVLAMVVLAPLFTLLAVGMGIAISSRVRDAQSAQQLGSLLILPVIGVLVAQVSGALTLGVGSIVTACIVIACIDVVLFAFAVKIFNRENILIHWR